MDQLLVSARVVGKALRLSLLIGPVETDVEMVLADIDPSEGGRRMAPCRLVVHERVSSYALGEEKGRSVPPCASCLRILHDAGSDEGAATPSGLGYSSAWAGAGAGTGLTVKLYRPAEGKPLWLHAAAVCPAPTSYELRLNLPTSEIQCRYTRSCESSDR